MRLIDADKLCEYALNQRDHSVDPNDIMRFPRVEAIPTKWLGEWALRRDNFFNYDFNSIIIDQVLYDWQKEQRREE